MPKLSSKKIRGPKKKKTLKMQLLNTKKTKTRRSMKPNLKPRGLRMKKKKKFRD